MKKVLRVLAVTLIVFLCSVSIVSAASYIDITFDVETTVEDHTPDPDWQVASWHSDTYGVGSTEKGDAIVIPDVDFGSAGPATVTMIVGNHADQTPKQIGIYLDKIDGTKIATLDIPNYKDWSDRQTITAKVTAEATGVHTVYAVWETAGGGSAWGISFTEKGAAASEASPKTGDGSLVLPISLLIVSLLALVVIYKKRMVSAN